MKTNTRCLLFIKAFYSFKRVYKLFYVEPQLTVAFHVKHSAVTEDVVTFCVLLN